MASVNVTHVVIGVALAVGSLFWIAGGARGLVTGQLTPRMVPTSGRRGAGRRDAMAISIWWLFWGIGNLALGIGALTGTNVLGFVGGAMITFGVVLSQLRDRYARRLSAGG
jgi:hypothetical protein